MTVQMIPYDGHEVQVLTSRAEAEMQTLAVERAGRTCYMSEVKTPTPESADAFTRKMIRMGHFSVIEHAGATVKVLNCSRGFTHSIVRNRLCTFSQQSTVHALECDDEPRFKLPPGVEPGARLEISLYDIAENSGHSYMALTWRSLYEMYARAYAAARAAGMDRVQARYLLPIATCNDIVISANLRQWRHVLRMRLGPREDWENILIANDLLARLSEIYPAAFFDFERDGEFVECGGVTIPTWRCGHGA